MSGRRSSTRTTRTRNSNSNSNSKTNSNDGDDFIEGSNSRAMKFNSKIRPISPDSSSEIDLDQPENSDDENSTYSQKFDSNSNDLALSAFNSYNQSNNNSQSAQQGFSDFISGDQLAGASGGNSKGKGKGVNMATGMSLNTSASPPPIETTEHHSGKKPPAGANGGGSKSIPAFLNKLRR